VQALNAAGKVLAYHDRSDGGLLAAAAEMAFAGHCGVTLTTSEPAALFSEELGMLLQIRASDAEAILAQLKAAGLAAAAVGAPSSDDRISCGTGFSESREALYKHWFQTSSRIAALRDNHDCVREEFESAGSADDLGLSVQLSPAVLQPPTSMPAAARRPRVAILREQGVNGQAEMAYAFDAAGFESVDVHMSDVLEGRVRLRDFAGLAACGGFSYGDVLGAGRGWAKTILFNARAREEFQAFLANPERFALGVCNGCQMFAALKSIVPGAESWPAFRRNRSEQFEARWTQVEVLESKSIFFAGMAGSRLPIAVAHGEGQAVFDGAGMLAALQQNGQAAMRFLDSHGRVVERYPQNPNGSPQGLTSVCNADGRVTVLMPHPERTIAGVTGSWWPRSYGRHTPWMQMFLNARKWAR